MAKSTVQKEAMVPGEAPLKRKAASAEEEVAEDAELGQFDLEMASDDESTQEPTAEHDEDDDSQEKFPELNVESDTESSTGDAGDSDAERDEEGEESETSHDDDDDAPTLRIKPEEKTITSEITGQLKRVYPPIEPDYDSDSSTEDVCSSC